MSTFELIVGDRSFPIPKKCVLANCDFFDAHPELYDAKTYQVETQAPVADFQDFVNYLKSKALSQITAMNIIPFSLLCDEFLASDLDEVCGWFLAANRPGTHVDSINLILSRRSNLNRPGFLKGSAVILTSLNNALANASVSAASSVRLFRNFEPNSTIFGTFLRYFDRAARP
jgi:hypothetical protein